jgi:hypothetical protein
MSHTNTCPITYLHQNKCCTVVLDSKQGPYGTRWQPPWFFLLLHKACWRAKRLAITRWLSPRLSCLHKEL